MPLLGCVSLLQYCPRPAKMGALGLGACRSRWGRRAEAGEYLSLLPTSTLCRVRGPDSHVLGRQPASCPLKGDKAAVLTLDKDGEISAHHAGPHGNCPLLVPAQPSRAAGTVQQEANLWGQGRGRRGQSLLPSKVLWPFIAL